MKLLTLTLAQIYFYSVQYELLIALNKSDMIDISDISDVLQVWNSQYTGRLWFLYIVVVLQWIVRTGKEARRGVMGCVCPSGRVSGTLRSTRGGVCFCLAVFACVHAVKLTRLRGGWSFSPHSPTSPPLGPSHARSSKRSRRRRWRGGEVISGFLLSSSQCVISWS